MVLHEATDALHWAMRITPYRPRGMVIEIVVNSVAFFYIVDYTLVNYSFMFTIKLYRFIHALALAGDVGF